MNYEEWKAKRLEDPEAQKKYEALKPKYDRIREKIKKELEKEGK